MKALNAADVLATARAILIAGAIGALALVLLRVLPGRGELSREAAAQGARADSLDLVIAAERERVQDLQEEAKRRAAEHAAAMAAADAGARALDAQVARARAAARDSLLTVETARAELEQMASTAEAYKRLAMAERRAADARIQPLEAISARITITYTAVDQLVDARGRQVEALEGQLSVWRRLLQLTCVGGGAAGGAALGSLAGGPGGAAVGAVLGVAGGALGCR